MPYDDLREFIERLKKAGDLIEIEEEVDWNLEAGAIMRRCSEVHAPAPLFNNIKGYPKGYRLLGELLATLRRFAIAMDMDPETPYYDLLDDYMNRRKNPVKPILVSDGPCKENIHIGKDVDLLKLPVPILHEGDGGRFIGTWNIGVCKDPDSDWMNWGTYRLMVHDKNSTGIAMIAHQHVALIYSKCEERGKPMEYAAFIGCDPIINFISTTGVPYGVSEADIIGGVRKEPLKLVKCETVDLLVPATAEIVIEGEMLPHIRKDEGPFGEYSGYQVSERGPRPVFKVKAITHRNDPILTATCTGCPIDAGHIVCSMGWSADLKDALMENGIPVTGIYVSPESALQICIVSVKTTYPQMASRIASCIWAHKDGMYIPRVMVVDDDVDPTNMEQVIHAFATKCHPVDGTIVMKAPTCVVTPYIEPHPEEKELLVTGHNVLYDCTWPKGRKKIPVRSSFNDIFPDDIKERVLQKWGVYGYTK